MSSITYSFPPFLAPAHIKFPEGEGREVGKAQNRKEKWKVGGREYFLLCYLSQSNKVLFCFGFISVSSSGALTPTSKMDRNVKIQEMTEEGYIWEAAAAHNTVERK